MKLKWNCYGPNNLDNDAEARNRTADLLITNQLLYQLSYPGEIRMKADLASRL